MCVLKLSANCERWDLWPHAEGWAEGHPNPFIPEAPGIPRPSKSEYVKANAGWSLEGRFSFQSLWRGCERRPSGILTRIESLEMSSVTGLTSNLLECTPSVMNSSKWTQLRIRICKQKSEKQKFISKYSCRAPADNTRAQSCWLHVWQVELRDSFKTIRVDKVIYISSSSSARRPPETQTLSMSADMRTLAVLRWRHLLHFHLWTWRMQSAVVRLTPRFEVTAGPYYCGCLRWTAPSEDATVEGVLQAAMLHSTRWIIAIWPSCFPTFTRQNISSDYLGSILFLQVCLEFDFFFLLICLGKAEFSFLWLGYWSRVISQSVMIAWKEMKQSLGIVFKPKWGLFHF